MVVEMSFIGFSIVWKFTHVNKFKIVSLYW
jgi:hypothetical protein